MSTKFRDPHQSLVLEQLKKALHLVCVSLPHLSGLAQLIRVHTDLRVATAGIFPSGRLVVNPKWFSQLDLSESTFVVAHEIMHLAMRSHDRSTQSDFDLFNIAHDYIINDILAVALDSPIPAGGLELDGARKVSAESLVQMLRKDSRFAGETPQSPWNREVTAIQQSGRIVAVNTALADAVRKSGMFDPVEGGRVESRTGGETGSQVLCDVLPDNLENDWFPDSNPLERAKVRRKIEISARKALSLGLIKAHADEILLRSTEPAEFESVVSAMRTCYRPPWESALQRWFETITPGARSYVRPSRRGADRTDVVLPGRMREGWTLHLVLDTSGSMWSELIKIMGVIASFCEGMNVDQVHILQCDVDVTKDDYVSPDRLYDYTIAGYGGSDMSPAMIQLARDPEVEAAIVLTDGCIEYPADAMPYDVLWVLTDKNTSFSPKYGKIIPLIP